MRRLGFLLLVCIAAAPATKPTTLPATWPSTAPAWAKSFDEPIPPLSVATARRARAKELLAAADRQARERFDATPAGIALIKDVVATEKALGAARESGTPNEKLNASAAFNAARQALEAGRAAAAKRDPSVSSAAAELESAEWTEVRARLEQERHESQAQLDAAEAERRRDELAQEFEARRMKNPIYRAIKEHRLEIGMTLEQAEDAMDGEGRLTTKHADGEVYYEWFNATVVDSRGRPSPLTVRYSAWFRDGKIVSFTRP